jgi:hypothetical protein
MAGRHTYVQKHTLACQKIQKSILFRGFCTFMLNFCVTINNFKKLQNTNNALYYIESSIYTFSILLSWNTFFVGTEDGTDPHCHTHSVGRVLSFFSSRRNWDSPTPLTCRRGCFGSGWAHSLAGKKVGKSQHRQGDIHFGTLYICVLCGYTWWSGAPCSLSWCAPPRSAPGRSPSSGFSWRRGPAKFLLKYRETLRNMAKFPLNVAKLPVLIMVNLLMKINEILRWKLRLWRKFFAKLLFFKKNLVFLLKFHLFFGFVCSLPARPSLCRGRPCRMSRGPAPWWTGSRSWWSVSPGPALLPFHPVPTQSPNF